MPNCIIEYSKNLEKDVSPDTLVKHVYQGTLNSKLFDVNDIRVRAIPFDYSVIGETDKSFIHVCLKIFLGRSDEECKKLSSLVLIELNKISLSNIVLTVEVVEGRKDFFSRETK